MIIWYKICFFFVKLFGKKDIWYKSELEIGKHKAKKYKKLLNPHSFDKRDCLYGDSHYDCGDK